jgi:phosphonate metabolism protein PhnN/1,5-bisphosphokinase (PRPP-forming)
MRVLLVVGPSGSGKDTLIRGAKRHFAGQDNVAFIRRYITRPPDRNEDNYYLDPTAFTLLSDGGFFLSTWQAHDNYYGIPYHAMGGTNGADAVLCSISRSAVGDFERQFEHTTTILVTAREEVLRQRLLRRGREDEAAVRNRLARATKPVVARDLISFDNSADLERSTAMFIELIETFSSRVTGPA